MIGRFARPRDQTSLQDDLYQAEDPIISERAVGINLTTQSPVPPGRSLFEPETRSENNKWSKQMGFKSAILRCFADRFSVEAKAFVENLA